MEDDRFDALIRLQANLPRRRVLLAAIAAAFTGSLAHADERTAAVSCQPRGASCRRPTQCCSGRCNGKSGKQTCRRTFSQNTCTIEQDSCRQGENSEVTGCNPDGPCFCYVTAKGASFCGLVAELATTCADCAEFAGTVCVRGGRVCDRPFACAIPCSRVINPGTGRT